YQVNAGRSAFPGQSSNHLFKFPLFVASGQDQVSKLVEHKDQKWDIRSPLLETIMKTDKPFSGEHMVSPVHLGDCITEYPKRGAEIGCDRPPEIRAASYTAEREHLRIDQSQP